ncbi:MAG TPA: formate dehydrogenase accessory protein FdhE [Syntrophomonadaceae bacterium]|nr:formate dehydrogenase accessory protein FdhE [Syntrophomonadaceae bacterium]
MTRELPVELPAGYVEFYMDLENWQNQEVTRLRKFFNPEKVDLLKRILQQKRPLLEQVKVEFDPLLIRESYHRFLEFLTDRRPDLADSLGSLITNLESLDLTQLVTPAWEIDQGFAEMQAEQFGLNQDLMLFTSDFALRTFLRVISESYRNELVDERFFWEFPNTCPVCGSKSYISRLKSDDGQRFMFCDRCFSEWKVRYLACVYCGHDKPGDINILKIDDDPNFRIYVCERCKGYLKTYDERTAGTPTDLFIANKETVYLDILARDYGYSTHDD